MKNNKKLNIASGVIGTVFAAAHIALVIYFICNFVVGNGAFDFGDYGIAGLAVAFFAVILKFIMMAVVVIVAFAGLFYLASSMVTIFVKSDKPRRVFSIINSVFLSIETFVEVTFVFGIIVRGFREGNFLSAFAAAAVFITTVSWLVLNIIVAQKSKTVQ